MGVLTWVSHLLSQIVEQTFFLLASLPLKRNWRFRISGPFQGMFFLFETSGAPQKMTLKKQQHGTSHLLTAVFPHENPS